MPNITTTTAAVFIPEKWTTDIIRETEANLVLAGRVKRFDSLINQNMKAGDTIHIPQLSNLVANDKLANNDVTFQAPTEGEVVLNIDKHKEASFQLEDIAAIQSNSDLNSEYTSKAGYALAEAIDSDLAALAPTFATAVGAYNTAITTDVILDAILALDDANVPQDDRSFVYTPKVKRDIIDITEYISNDFVDGRPVQTGLIGQLYGVQTFMSTNILVTGGTDTSNMLFHKDAIALAMQRMPRTETQRMARAIATDVVTDTIYGYVLQRPDFGVEVRT